MLWRQLIINYPFVKEVNPLKQGLKPRKYFIEIKNLLRRLKK